MHTIQEEMGVKGKKPPIGAATRWAGLIPMLMWVNENCTFIKKYDIQHPRDCVSLEDGSHYQDYFLQDDDWEIINQLVSKAFQSPFNACSYVQCARLLMQCNVFSSVVY